MTNKLTNKQQRFADEYLLDLNATQAAIRAGYSKKTAEQLGHQLLKKTSVMEAIAKGREKAQERTQITLDRVLAEYAKLAFFDPRRLFRDDGTPKGIHELDDATAAAICGIDVEDLFEGYGEDREQTGRVRKYKIINKKEALTDLMRHLGGFDKDSLNVKVDGLTSLIARIGIGGSRLKPVEDPSE